MVPGARYSETSVNFPQSQAQRGFSDTVADPFGASIVNCVRSSHCFVTAAARRKWPRSDQAEIGGSGLPPESLWQLKDLRVLRKRWP
jgi:hypothetical protein